MRKVKYLNARWILLYLRKAVIITAFSSYVVVMGKIYLHYKRLNPGFDSSMLKERPYLIDTEGYKLPDFDPFDSSVLGFIQDPPNLDCSEGRRPLTSSSSTYFDLTSGSREPSSVVFLHRDHIRDYGEESFACCFQAIKRNRTGDPRYTINDSEYFYPDARFFVEKQCHALEKDVTVVDDSAVLVQCATGSSVIYRTLHLFINAAENSRASSEDPERDDAMNVMIFGLDSTSRLNMQRYLPKTFKALKDIDAVDLMGFNKNYENTYPSLIAILSGYYEKETRFRNYIKRAGGFYDDAPFIWKNFSSAGYTTVYGEDCSEFGTFAYKSKKGFRNPPTDFYLRPFMKASEDLLGWKGGVAWFSGCNFCSGAKLGFQHIVDYAEDLSEKFFYSKRKHFSLLWSSSLTHDRINFAGVADASLANMVKNINEEPHWSNTIVFFISDHGARFGRIRETYIGRKEESLPYVFVILPKRFKEKYSSAYENLLFNRFRLTTTQDIHETLKDILQQKYKNEDYIKANHTIDKSEFRLSLFKKIPGTRTCLDANIIFQYCAGVLANEVPESAEVQLAAKIVLDNINQGLKNFTDCHQLSIATINKSYLVQFFEDETLDYTLYEVQIITSPGEARLEGLVKLGNNGRVKNELLGSVSRINSYRGQSDCISDPVYVKYCLCK